jgi:hypothetical protein
MHTPIARRVFFKKEKEIIKSGNTHTIFRLLAEVHRV